MITEEDGGRRRGWAAAVSVLFLAALGAVGGCERDESRVERDAALVALVGERSPDKSVDGFAALLDVAMVAQGKERGVKEWTPQFVDAVDRLAKAGSFRAEATWHDDMVAGERYPTGLTSDSGAIELKHFARAAFELLDYGMAAADGGDRVGVELAAKSLAAMHDGLSRASLEDRYARSLELLCFLNVIAIRKHASDRDVWPADSAVLEESARLGEAQWEATRNE